MEDSLVKGKVLGRSVGPKGTLIRSYDDNPMLNLLRYDIEFPNRQVKEHLANVIAENVLSRVDQDGFSVTLLEALTDYQKDDSAIGIADKYVITPKGRKRLRRTTQGWKLKVLWKDQSESLMLLKDLKESNPVEVAEFTKARGIDNEPAFCLLLPHVLKKRDAIIATAVSRARKTMHKHGIEIPTDTKAANRLDKKDSSTFLIDAIKKEMHDVGAAFKILGSNAKLPVGVEK